MANTRAPFTIYPARQSHHNGPHGAGRCAPSPCLMGAFLASGIRGHWQRGDNIASTIVTQTILMPGLIEGHSHLLEGGIWDHPYVGFYERRSPDGSTWPALRSIASCDRPVAAVNGRNYPIRRRRWSRGGSIQFCCGALAWWQPISIRFGQSDPLQSFTPTFTW